MWVWLGNCEYILHESVREWEKEVFRADFGVCGSYFLEIRVDQNVGPSVKKQDGASIVKMIHIL